MPKASIFISHSSADAPFAVSLVEALRESDLVPWIDKERILVGRSIIEEIGKGLTTMDLFVLIVSDTAMKSGWVQKEADYAAYREVAEKRALILPFVIDNTKVTDLPWHIQIRNVATITPNLAGIDKILASVRHSLELRDLSDARQNESRFQRVPAVESLIMGRALSDWDGAEKSALTVLAQTDARGRNELFRTLLTYKDARNHDALSNALAIAEMCVRIAPWVIDRSDIFELANHANYSVRASAASMCMEIANIEPSRVPVDILITLSRYDEDWYVQAPANAALKTMAHTAPGVLHIFMERLQSEKPDEREHAASQLVDISREEPEILNRDLLAGALVDLREMKDKTSTELLNEALANIKDTKQRPKYRYGL